MSFLKPFFNKKHNNNPIKTYQDFWDWFLQHQEKFYAVIKNQGDVQNELFEPITEKIDAIKDGIWFLVGMKDDNTAELVFTPDGVVKNVVFVEELVAEAPRLNHWEFTALKPAIPIDKLYLEMQGYNFNQDKLSFYAVEYPDHPDLIEIVVVHEDYNQEDAAVITNGTFIFLDNYLGELNHINTIDYLSVTSKKDATQELIPISKLKDFLIWRQKEFIEKYEGTRNHTADDNYALLEATLENGMPLLATVNTDLLNWDGKASHPWLATIIISYQGQEDNGMPDEADYQLLNEIEDKILEVLKDEDGFLNIGRETADSVREIYFACIDFRKPAKALHQIQQNYKDKINITYDIYKDKYWQAMDKYRVK